MSSSVTRAPGLVADPAPVSGTLALIRRAGGVAFAIQVAGAGVAYLQQVLLARLLGASHYGLYTYIYLWAGFVALLAGLGLPAASLRFVPAYRAAGDAVSVHGFVRTAGRATYASALAVAGAAALAALALRAAGASGAPLYLLLAGLLVPALAGSILYSELARARGRIATAYVAPQIARPALIGVGAVLLAGTAGVSSAGVLAVTVAGAYLVLVVQRRATMRMYEPTAVQRYDRAARREWLGVGGSLLAVSAFVVVLMQLDIVIVGTVLGPREAGVYAAAARTATLVSFVIVAVNAAAAPRFAALWAQGRVDELQRLVTRLAGLIFWPSVAIAAGLAVLSGPLLALFGPGFDQARPALLVLLAGQLVNAGAGSVGYLLTLTGYHREATVALGFSALLFVVLAAAGALTFGLLGVAVGSMLGFVTWNVWLCVLVWRRLSIRASILGGAR